MCQIFVRTDPELYRSRSRSMRLRGVSTSIRLENLFWRVLGEIGARDGLSMPQLVSKLYDELAEAGDAGREAHANFSSFLRVCCTRYLALQVGSGEVAGTALPPGALDGVPARVAGEPAAAHAGRTH